MYSFRELSAPKPRNAYTEQQLQNIKLITAGNKDAVFPFGSATYRVQKYPGDLDLLEIFQECCTVDAAVKKFEVVIKKIARNIKKNKLHYFSEFKAGYDNRFKVDIGNIQNGIFEPNQELYNYSKLLYKKKLISKKELTTIDKILSVSGPGGNEYDMLKYIFREHMVLRWTSDEVIKGVKVLPGKVNIKLFDALKMKSHIKIDMITLVNNLFVEVTNFFVLMNEDKQGNLHPINLEYDFLDPKQKVLIYDEQLKNDIEKLYYSNMYYNPFKMAKRMWAYSRTLNFPQQLKTLTPLITGDISYLYQINSEVGTILRLFELKKYPIATIDKQLDLMKQKLSNVLFIVRDDLEIIYSVIDNFLKNKNKIEKENLLKILKKHLSALINFQTIEGLNAINYNPPPRMFLPEILKYSSIVRDPSPPLIL